jgi:hypothetical protein
MSALLPPILALHAAATLMMTGLVWFVHAVHYPMFATVARGGDDRWRDYEREHLRRTGLVIPPIMLPEAAAALALPFFLVEDRAVALAWVGVALLAIVWISTFAGAVPMHARLERGFDPAAHRWLMRHNLLRALAWTARSAVALLLLLPGA